MVVIQRRKTTQRAAITAHLADVDEFISAQELHAQLRQSGSPIGLATVYRTLQEWAGSHQVDTVRNESGEVLYRLCAPGPHHHHLVCRRCGSTEELVAPDIEGWAKAVSQERGYTDVDHHVELFGLCPACSAAPAS